MIKVCSYLPLKRACQSHTQSINGSFTLPDTETQTDTDTDQMCTESNGNLHRSQSLSCMNTPMQFYTNHLLSASLLTLSRCLAV